MFQTITATKLMFECVAALEEMCARASNGSS